MKRILLLGVLAGLAFGCQPARAQLVSGLAPPITQADVSAAAANAATVAASTVAAQAAAAAAAAAQPAICTSPPAQPGMVATAGTAAPCLPRADAAPATQNPVATAVTASDGTFTGNWLTSYASPPSRAIATVDGSTPVHCQVVTKTTTGFTGKCWLVNYSSTLPSLATSLLGYAINFLSNAAAGITVNVFARQ
jgi:hypothetical protein